MGSWDRRRGLSGRRRRCWVHAWIDAREVGWGAWHVGEMDARTASSLAAWGGVR